MTMAAILDENRLRSIIFPSQVDSLDYSPKRGQLVCSNSNLEGDLWDGSINIVNLAGDAENPELSVRSKAGCSSAKFVGFEHENVSITLITYNVMTMGKMAKSTHDVCYIIPGRGSFR